MTLEDLLQQGLEAMDLSLGRPIQQKLVTFLRILDKWNRSYNLTAVRDPAQMVPRHLLDSLSVLPYVRGPRVLDVGTGAGLPGIPLALALPDLTFALLDSNAKKVRFLRHAVQELGMQNVEIVHARVEKFQPVQRFDTLIARAFAGIPDILASCRHLCDPGCRLLLMKGVYPQEELAAVSGPFKVKDVIPLKVPGLDAARHLIIVCRL